MDEKQRKALKEELAGEQKISNITFFDVEQAKIFYEYDELEGEKLKKKIIEKYPSKAGVTVKPSKYEELQRELDDVRVFGVGKTVLQYIGTILNNAFNAVTFSMFKNGREKVHVDEEFTFAQKTLSEKREDLKGTLRKALENTAEFQGLAEGKLPSGLTKNFSNSKYNKKQNGAGKSL